MKEGRMFNSAFRLFFVAMLLCNASAAAQELKKIRIGYPSLGVRQGHIWVARDEGLFKKWS
jgi:ABC-type nitrate/sulfonate/bicarbonate transport system substrate-binding protein